MPVDGAADTDSEKGYDLQNESIEPLSLRRATIAPLAPLAAPLSLRPSISFQGGLDEHRTDAPISGGVGDGQASTHGLRDILDEVCLPSRLRLRQPGRVRG